MTDILDPISEQPSITEANGRAWLINPEVAQSRGESPSIAVWLIEAPWASETFHSYCASLIHLRPTATMPEPNVRMSGATHELCVFALDPSAPRQSILEDGRCSILTPAMIQAQMRMPNDATAMGQCEGAVRAICAGSLTPNMSGGQAWVEHFEQTRLRNQQ